MINVYGSTEENRSIDLCIQKLLKSGDENILFTENTIIRFKWEDRCLMSILVFNIVGQYGWDITHVMLSPVATTYCIN